MNSRPEKRGGPTYCAKMDDGNMYVSVNHDDGKPYEVFARYDKKEYHETVVLITRLVSMALREGVPLDVVARELKDIHSPVTQHILPGTTEMVPSLAARIGIVLESHVKNYNPKAAA